jgi:hypothetical protein
LPAGSSLAGEAASPSSSEGAGEASASPSSSPSEAPSIAAPSSSTSAEPSAGIFSQPPDPLNLSPATADDLAVSKAIGPKGGTITAKGADGTSFTLQVPADDLPMAMTITMTPLVDLTGFPIEATPDHQLGVQLEPDSLELGDPAILTIRPSDGFPDAGVVAMDYQADGQEAGFHLFDQGPDQVTISIDHFSGYSAEFPLAVEQIQRIAQALQTDPADVLASQIAARIAIERQKQLLGEETEIPLRELALEYLPLFLQVVLAPRVAVAGRGCSQANAAMKAILAYQRTRQELGVGTDPAFDIQAGVLVPATLADLAIRLCFREAFAECVATGDFPWLAGRFMATFRQYRHMLGIEPTPEEVQLAQGYLQRCGRYRLDATAHQIGKADFTVTVDIDLEWKPGSGEWGLVGSTIEGSGDQVFSPLPMDLGECFTNPGREQKLIAIRTVWPGTARIDGLAFVHVRGVTLPARTPIPAAPQALQHQVGFGLMEGRTPCGYNDMTPVTLVWVPAVLQELGVAVHGNGVTGPAVASVKDGWTFTTGPFTATRHFSGSIPTVTGDIPIADLDISGHKSPYQADIDLTLTHTPG